MRNRRSSWLAVGLAVSLGAMLAGCPSPTQPPANAPDDKLPTPASPTAEAEGEHEGPSAIPHEVKGKESCTSCHQVGSGVGKMPADHAGRADDACVGCHKPAM